MAAPRNPRRLSTCVNSGPGSLPRFANQARSARTGSVSRMPAAGDRHQPARAVLIRPGAAERHDDALFSKARSPSSSAATAEAEQQDRCVPLRDRRGLAARRLHDPPQSPAEEFTDLEATLRELDSEAAALADIVADLRSATARASTPTEYIDYRK